MLEASTTEGLVEALRETWRRGDEWFVLGGGSNLFVGDEPFEGTVIRVRTEGIDELPSPHAGRIRLRAQAGHGWDDFVAYAVAHGMLTMGIASSVVVAALEPTARIVDYGERFTKPVVVDPETGADVHVLATVGAVEETAARIDLKVTFGDATVLVKAQLRVAI
jgi:UDP-N-acetylmuramate dehydrogenase